MTPQSRFQALVTKYQDQNRVSLRHAMLQCKKLHPKEFAASQRPAILANSSINGLHATFWKIHANNAKLRQQRFDALRSATIDHHIPREKASDYVDLNFPALANAKVVPLSSIFMDARAREKLKLGIAGNDSAPDEGELTAAMIAAAPKMNIGSDPYPEVWQALNFVWAQRGLDPKAAAAKVAARHPALTEACDFLDDGDAVATENLPVASSPIAATLANATNLRPAPPRTFSAADASNLGLAGNDNPMHTWLAWGANGESTDPAAAVGNREKIVNSLTGYTVAAKNLSLEDARADVLKNHPKLAA